MRLGGLFRSAFDWTKTQLQSEGRKFGEAMSSLREQGGSVDKFLKGILGFKQVFLKLGFLGRSIFILVGPMILFLGFVALGASKVMEQQAQRTFERVASPVLPVITPDPAPLVKDAVAPTKVPNKVSVVPAVGTAAGVEEQVVTSFSVTGLAQEGRYFWNGRFIEATAVARVRATSPYNWRHRGVEGSEILSFGNVGYGNASDADADKAMPNNTGLTRLFMGQGRDCVRPSPNFIGSFLAGSLWFLNGYSEREAESIWATALSGQSGDNHSSMLRAYLLGHSELYGYRPEQFRSGLFAGIRKADRQKGFLSLPATHPVSFEFMLSNTGQSPITIQRVSLELIAGDSIHFGGGGAEGGITGLRAYSEARVFDYKVAWPDHPSYMADSVQMGEIRDSTIRKMSGEPLSVSELSGGREDSDTLAVGRASSSSSRDEGGASDAEVLASEAVKPTTKGDCDTVSFKDDLKIVTGGRRTIVRSEECLARQRYRQNQETRAQRKEARRVAERNQVLPVLSSIPAHPVVVQAGASGRFRVSITNGDYQFPQILAQVSVQANGEFRRVGAICIIHQSALTTSE
jgi:hypothetical protein